MTQEKDHFFYQNTIQGCKKNLKPLPEKPCKFIVVFLFDASKTINS